MNKHTEETDITIFSPQRLDAQAPLADVLSSRRSPRAFSERPIESSKIMSLFEAARWAPSSANEQPWHFIAATREDLHTFDALLNTLYEGNRRWASRAPLLVLALAQTSYAKNGKPYRHAWYDLGQSVAHLTVEATSLGLSVHQMGGFDAEKARELFAIAEGNEPVVLFAVGYADRPENLPDDLRQREESPRSRKPLEDLVYTEAWGTPSRLIGTPAQFIKKLTTNN